jgi:hypothetical protein
MVAFTAAEEPDLALICRPQLPEPPECKVVFAFRAFDLDRRQRSQLLVVFHDYDLVLGPFCLLLHLVLFRNFPYITTLTTFQLACRSHQNTFTLRTEHLPMYALAFKINPCIGHRGAIKNGNPCPFCCRERILFLHSRRPY